MGVCIRLAALVVGVTSASATASAQQTVALGDRGSSAPSARAFDELLSRPVTLDVRDMPLRRAIAAAAVSANVPVQYTTLALDAYGKSVTLRVTKVPLRVVFERMLAGTTLRVIPDGATQLCIVETGDPSTPQLQGVIAGTVVDAKTKRPIPGARLTLDASDKDIVADADGAFRISASVGEHAVHVRAVGYLKQSQRVVVTEGETVTAAFSLTASASVLDEVVVTGTVVATERKAIPTPITVITADDIEKRGITRVDQLFRGEVPGVIALEPGSDRYDASPGAMASTQLYVRGATALPINSSSAPGTNPLKTYVDGVEMVDPSYLGTIDPKSIEKIEIITGPQAATIYGSGAMGGVMQIFTKKGRGGNATDITLGIKYGMLENNMSNGRAPSHDHLLSVIGGTGPDFSYNATLSHQYTGQWRPQLFYRIFGASVGATHVRGPMTVNGSVSVTGGRNGTFYSVPLMMYLRSIGEFAPTNWAGANNSTQSTSSSQILSANIDFRPISWWQHHLTVGRSQNTFTVDPTDPKFTSTTDTMFRMESAENRQVTLNYNTTLIPQRLGPISQTLTVGANGSFGHLGQIVACAPSDASTSLLGCYVNQGPQVTELTRKNWGGFGSWQVGLFDKLFLTAGLRGERNPFYGGEYAIDWTPTTGATYTFSVRDLTVKLLGSYGRATRAPQPDQRLESYTLNSPYSPSQYVARFANDELTPEYSSGPQGGIELYYGNLGSLTVNHYKQRVSGLIQQVPVDSIYLTYPPIPGYGYWQVQYQNRNVATVRQQGWEATSAVNFGPLALKGTYSWNDSRIESVDPKAFGAGSFYVGQSFLTVPTHTGNVTASYAWGGTSVTWVTNFVGTSLHASNDSFIYQAQFAVRLPVYYVRKASMNFENTRAGYAKSDLAVSQRLNPWASLTLNVTNLGNSFGSEAYALSPALGRQTVVGVSLRYPTKR